MEKHDTLTASLLQQLRRKLRRHGYRVSKSYARDRFLVYRLLSPRGIDWGVGGSDLSARDLLRVADRIEGGR